MLVGKRTRREEKSDGMTCQKVNDRLIFTAFTFRLGTMYTTHISLTLCKALLFSDLPTSLIGTEIQFVFLPKFEFLHPQDFNLLSN